MQGTTNPLSPIGCDSMRRYWLTTEKIVPMMKTLLTTISLNPYSEHQPITKTPEISNTHIKLMITNLFPAIYVAESRPIQYPWMKIVKRKVIRAKLSHDIFYSEPW